MNIIMLTTEFLFIFVRKQKTRVLQQKSWILQQCFGCEDREGPIHWLQTAWYDLIHRVMIELSTPENSQEIGNISPEEVREALIDCTGEVSRAVNKCMENRKKKVTVHYLF